MPRQHQLGQNDAGDRAPGAAGPCRPGGRLNLLLSYAGWDHESWVDRLPRLLEPMGVVALRAGTGREASDVIQHNPIHIAVVDLGLPLDEPAAKSPAAAELPEMEEGGSRLLEILSRLAQPPPTVVVKRGRTHRDDCREIGAALRAGAFAVIDRPHNLTDLEMMLGVLRRCMDRFYKSRWPGTA